jgi:predicted aldo/keto reductase-like oxidoreductase
LGVRDRAVIGTKVYIPHEQRPALSPAELKKIFIGTAEESLKRLQADYIDILYVHSCNDADFPSNPGIQEALDDLKSQKKARFIGLSTHMNMAACLKYASDSGFYDVALTAFNYSMADDVDYIAALRASRAKNLGLLAMKTQCPPVGGYKVPSDKLSFYKGKIMQTAVLKWVLGHDFISTAIPGYTTFDQMEEDFSVARDLRLTPEEQKFLEDRGVKLALQSCCVQCGKCVPTCPLNADIPALMRTYLYAAGYGNFSEARDALEGIARDRGLEACASCEACAARCARAVPIGRRIGELKTIYT